jgi:hypothetical protein
LELLSIGNCSNLRLLHALARSLQKLIRKAKGCWLRGPDEEEQRPHPRRATVNIEIRLRSTRTSIKRQTV